MDAACEAADGTVSASPTTSRTSEGWGDQICSTMTASPVPVNAMSLISCQAVAHFTSPASRTERAAALGVMASPEVGEIQP